MLYLQATESSWASHDAKPKGKNYEIVPMKFFNIMKDSLCFSLSE